MSVGFELRDYLAFIDFESISETTDGVGHFDEVEHMRQLRETATANQLVATTMDMFDGQIVDVHEAKSKSQEG